MSTRYSRQIVLPEIGAAGQALLGKARILVVGAGGLGSPASLYLTAAGVGLDGLGGCIGLIDDDTVDCTNLQRQILFRESDQGGLKVTAAQQHLSDLNSETRVVVHAERLNIANALSILADYDIIIDGSDNFATKYLLNDAAAKLGKPVVYGSILGFEGQVSVFWAAQGPCYRCIYPEPAMSHIPNCAEAGTLGGIAGVVGSIQAVEACKLSLGAAHCRQYGLEPLIGKLLVFDALTWDIRKLELDKKATCPTCAMPMEEIALPETTDGACDTPPIKTISLSDLNDLYETGAPITLVDVREASEWAQGHLNQAIHLPLLQLLTTDEALDQLEKNSLIVIYCQHGVRSLRAAKYLATLGFNALNLTPPF